MTRMRLLYSQTAASLGSVAKRIQQAMTLAAALTVLLTTTTIIAPLQGYAQVAPDWQKKVEAKDKATVTEEQRLEAYKKNIPELYKRANDALTSGDKKNYKKYLEQLKQTLAYVNQVFAKKYAPWYTPDYFEKTLKTPDGKSLDAESALRVAQAYKYGPKQLVERQRRYDRYDRKADMEEGAEALKKEGLLKSEPKDDVTKAYKDPEAEDFKTIENAKTSCDPKEVQKALALLEVYRRKYVQLGVEVRLEKLRQNLSMAEMMTLDTELHTVEQALALIKKLEDELQAALKKCKPPADKSTQPDVDEFVPKKVPYTLPSSYQSMYHTAQTEAWSNTSKPLPEDGLVPPPVPRKEVSAKGDWVMTTPSPASPESSGGSAVKNTISEMCDMLVSTYRQNLMASVDEGWHSPKPPKKGIYTAKFTYRIQPDGGLFLPPNGEAIHMEKSSGYGPIDQSAQQRIFQLFGPSAPTKAMGGYKRPLPSCYTEGTLEIDHTFKVIYR